MMLAIGLSYIALIMLRCIPFIPSFIRAFYHERTLNFNTGFFCISWDDQVVFVFASVNVLYYIYDSRMIPGMQPTWSWCMIFLICDWIQFAIILLRIFASMFIKEIGL
jgi:hypothetical protein